MDFLDLTAHEWAAFRPMVSLNRAKVFDQATFYTKTLVFWNKVTFLSNERNEHLIMIINFG